MEVPLLTSTTHEDFMSLVLGKTTLRRWNPRLPLLMSFPVSDDIYLIRIFPVSNTL